MGGWTNVLEQKCDQISDVLYQDTGRLDDHDKKILEIEYKLEDMENRSKRANVRIRGIAKNITDLTSYNTVLFKIDT